MTDHYREPVLRWVFDLTRPDLDRDKWPGYSKLITDPCHCALCHLKRGSVLTFREFEFPDGKRMVPYVVPFNGGFGGYSMVGPRP